MVRNPGRLLAPIAIAAVAVGVYLIVHSNTGTHHRSAVRATAEHVQRTHAHGRRTRPKPTFYTVRAGDTMSQIASRMKVTLVRLEALNPSLAPTYTLHTGQRLRLRR